MLEHQKNANPAEAAKGGKNQSLFSQVLEQHKGWEFKDLQQAHSLRTPQQLRDQLLFNMLRNVMEMLEPDNERRRILYTLEAQFRIAQSQGF